MRKISDYLNMLMNEDMALVGLLDKTNHTYDLAYLTHIKALETWCYKVIVYNII